MQRIKGGKEIIAPDWTSARGYNRGAIVRYDDKVYICDVTHNAKTVFNNSDWTRLSGSSGSAGGGDSVPELTEITQSISIGAETTVFTDVEIGTNKCDLRTLYFVPDGGGDTVQIKIYESAARVFCAYTSNTEEKIYDILNIPYIDKDLTKKLHMAIYNSHTSSITGTLIVKITSLK